MKGSAACGRTRIPVFILAIILLLLSAACGGGGNSEKSDGDSLAADQRLVLSLTSTNNAAGGITVDLAASNAAGLYQLSSRLTFNPDAVRPLAPAEPGSLPAADAIFYSNDRQTGYLPVAFSNRQAQAIGVDSGTIFTARFEVLDPAADPGFGLVRDPQFLIARDNAAQDIELTVEVSR